MPFYAVYFLYYVAITLIYAIDCAVSVIWGATLKFGEVSLTETEKSELKTELKKSNSKRKCKVNNEM
jgi:hypothetical protein